jgi:hypothetical protein
VEGRTLIFLIILRRIEVGIRRSQDLSRGSTATARSVLGDLSGGGDRPDLLG